MTQKPAPAPGTGDPLVDEVRAIRRAVCDEAGNDVDRLVEKLKAVEDAYRGRRGPFADVPRADRRESG